MGFELHINSWFENFRIAPIQDFKVHLK